jgi:hypothetical protein
MKYPCRFLNRLLRLACLTLAGLATLSSSPAQTTDSATSSPSLRWWKGNLHTHSLWSDGDDFPEMIADWYRSQGYNFLALSDHNILSDGTRWMRFSEIERRADATILDKYRRRFGDVWVETRGKAGSEEFEVRLKPLDEFAPLLTQAGQFIMIPGEEISDRAEGKPVHMNATNIRDLIQPVGGATVREAIENNLRAVLEQEERTGREILPHVNHPNFGYAITAEDLAHVVQEQFFEVYNGHPGVNQLGDDEHISIERMWDVANAIRLTQLDAEPLLGIATDDSHEYHGKPGARPGRGWVMVQARYLTPEHLIRAMKAGEFYATSGVSLSEIRFDPARQELALRIEPQSGAEFTTEFVAILKPQSPDGMLEPDEIGTVVATQSGPQPAYRLTGKELMIRARVTSSQKHPDPSFPDQQQQAWTQPIVAR